jgi:endogenous inhibitor of DNA gyrase (YacG/DUF329 family)
MPWLKCGECRRVILVSEDNPTHGFLCEKCKPLFDLVWSEEWPVGMTMTLNEYRDLKQKMMQGTGNPEIKHGE